MFYLRVYKAGFLLLTPLFVFLLLNFPAALHAEENNCVSCHTSGGKLIKIIREIEARKPKVEKEIESEGEG